MSARLSTVVVALMMLTVPHSSAAQIRGFGDIGAVRFTATESFDTVLESPGGVIFGGGVEVDLPKNFFVAFRVSQFRKDGHRAFVFEDNVFPLNTETTITVRPIELSVGYRFDNARSPLVPYVGGGIGWHQYKETSAAAIAGEDVSETFTGYQVMGGVMYRLGRLFGVAGEGSWSSVPNALGDDPNSVAAALDESDLGGFTARVKFVVGR